MDKLKNLYFILRIYLFLISCLTSFTEEVCEKSKCPGPLQFYSDLHCQPIYDNPGDCCAKQYNCSHITLRLTNKCYVNENVYEIGDKLKEEDAGPCDIGCLCTLEGYNNIAGFVCAVVDCFGKAKPGCYLENSPEKCCPGPEICPDENKAVCRVNEKVYNEGDYFEIGEEPDKFCYCKKGYRGENVEPFCHTRRKNICGTELRHAYEIHSKCAPVYYSSQSPQTDCSVSYRCQNTNDVLITNSKLTEESSGENVTSCIFGTIIMKIGDELNQATDYSSVCVKCKCEVPPVPTCQRLPDTECDVTIHPKFKFWRITERTLNASG